MSRRRQRASRERYSAPRRSRLPRGRIALLIAGVGLAGVLGVWWIGRPHILEHAAPDRPNILLVTIDTLRWDRLGCYGRTGAATPVLDGLARRGTRFDVALAHVPLTGPSHASILTGLTPIRHGVHDNGGFVLPASLPTLATRLAQAGYATAAFVSGFPLDHRFGFGSGFDRYDDHLPRGTNPGRDYTERRADDTTAQVLGWFDSMAQTGPAQGGRPWFVWLHYFDPHAPYDPPPPYAERFPGERAYDGEVAFVDAQLGRVLHAVETRGDLDRTLVLATADHGESLGEHGEDTHGVFIYDSTLRVPFIVEGPGVRPGHIARPVARSTDIVPTLLDLAGLPIPHDLDGRSLRDALAGHAMSDGPVYLESLMAARHLGWAPLYGLRTQDWKFIDAPRQELYDLSRDPGERRDLAAETAPVRDRLARRLRRLLDAPPVAAAGSDSGAQSSREDDNRAAVSAVDRQTAAQLQSLGYLAGTPAPRPTATGRDPKDGIALIGRLERAVADSRVAPARAVQELDSITKAEPDIALARRYLALSLIQLRRHADARAQLDWLRAHNAATSDDLLVLSESLRVTGDEVRAAALVREAQRLDPRSPDPVLTEARGLMAAGRPGEAEAAYRRALALAPGHPEALVGLGDAALARGDASGAVAFFQQAHERDAADPIAALRLAVVRARMGQVVEAIPLFMQAVERRPDDADALAGLAAALARTGRAREAVPYFERAVRAGSRSPAVFNGLGFARLESGDAAGAFQAWRSSLALDPNQPRIAEMLRDPAAIGASR